MINTLEWINFWEGFMVDAWNCWWFLCLGWINGFLKLGLFSLFWLIIFRIRFIFGSKFGGIFYGVYGWDMGLWLVYFSCWNSEWVGYILVWNLMCITMWFFLRTHECPHLRKGSDLDECFGGIENWGLDLWIGWLACDVGIFSSINLVYNLLEWIVVFWFFGFYCIFEFA
jgi:hypothetical protein